MGVCFGALYGKYHIYSICFLHFVFEGEELVILSVES